MRKGKLIFSIVSFVMCAAVVQPVLSFCSPCISSKMLQNPIYYRLSPQQKALRACCVNCRAEHWDWMKKCEAQSTRTYDPCRTVAKTSLMSCLATCAVIPGKSCYTIKDPSIGF